MIVRPVAPFSQSMSPWRATATHFVPKTTIFNMFETSRNYENTYTVTHNSQELSISIKNSTK